jgi:hypothetical protein
MPEVEVHSAMQVNVQTKTETEADTPGAALTGSEAMTGSTKGGMK